MADENTQQEQRTLIARGGVRRFRTLKDNKIPITIGVLVVAGLATAGYSGYKAYKNISVDIVADLGYTRPGAPRLRRYTEPTETYRSGDSLELSIPGDVRCSNTSGRDLVQREFTDNNNALSLDYLPLEVNPGSVYTCSARHPADKIDKVVVSKLKGNAKFGVRTPALENDQFRFKLPKEPGVFEVKFIVVTPSEQKHRVITLYSGEKPKVITEPEKPYEIDSVRHRAIVVGAL